MIWIETTWPCTPPASYPATFVRYYRYSSKAYIYYISYIQENVIVKK